MQQSRTFPPLFIKSGGIYVQQPCENVLSFVGIGVQRSAWWDMVRTSWSTSAAGAGERRDLCLGKFRGSHPLGSQSSRSSSV